MEHFRYGYLVLVLLFLFSLCACNAELDSTITEKETVISTTDFAYPSFEDACENAHTIVIGEVTDVPEAWLQEIVHPNGKVIGYEAYTDIELSVKETLKGKQKKKVTYVQMGGETEEKIYVIDTVQPLRMGDRVLIFLNEDGHMVPGYVLPISDDDSIPAAFFPEGYAPVLHKVYVDDYAKQIRDYLKN